MLALLVKLLSRPVHYANTVVLNLLYTRALQALALLLVCTPTR
jgi:hypothetical protein